MRITFFDRKATPKSSFSLEAAPLTVAQTVMNALDENCPYAWIETGAGGVVILNRSSTVSAQRVASALATSTTRVTFQ